MNLITKWQSAPTWKVVCLFLCSSPTISSLPPKSHDTRGKDPSHLFFHSVSVVSRLLISVMFVLFFTVNLYLCQPGHKQSHIDSRDHSCPVCHHFTSSLNLQSIPTQFLRLLVITWVCCSVMKSIHKTWQPSLIVFPDAVGKTTDCFRLQHQGRLSKSWIFPMSSKNKVCLNFKDKAVIFLLLFFFFSPNYWSNCSPTNLTFEIPL